MRPGNRPTNLLPTCCVPLGAESNEGVTMDRLREGNSRLPRFFLWLFVVTVFSDAANLDDLLFSSPVIHDDEEIVSASRCTSCDSPISPDAQRMGIPGPHLIRERLGISPARMHIIVDQDSPSLPANRPEVLASSLSLVVNEPSLPPGVLLPGQPLHILFRSLLI